MQKDLGAFLHSVRDKCCGRMVTFVCVCACVYTRVIGSVISVSQVLDKMGSKKHVIYFVLVPRLRLHITNLRFIFGKWGLCTINWCNPRQAEKKEAESATGSAGDTADTLPMPDDHHQQILDHMLDEEELEAEEMFDFIINGSQAEGGEEEEREHDEVVEAVVDHEDSNNYADVGDDDDDDAMTPAQSKEAAAAKTPPKVPKKQAARSKAEATELAAPQPDDEAEEVASDGDGEGDGQTSKGTHKDPTILLMPLFVFVLRMGLESASMHVSVVPGFLS